MPKQRVTMADVADDVGVSIMTISRVINNKGDVSVQTAQRVWAAIERLDYRPSSIARGLATSQTQTVGLVVPDVGNPFFSDIARGVERQAHTAGYSVFLCNTEEDAAREMSALKSLDDQQVAGILLCSSRLSDPDIEELAARVAALVLINRRVVGPNGLAVVVDDHLGSRRATGHLIETGHRAIGLLAGPAASASSQQRIAGYRQALTDAGIALNPAWVRSCRPQVDAAQSAAAEFLADHRELTALICYNDLVAVGALRACVSLGVNVPQELAVVGFDDILLAELVTPALTTCRVPREALGRNAMALLLAKLDGRPIEQPVIVVEPELIVRQSAPFSVAAVRP